MGGDEMSPTTIVAIVIIAIIALALAVAAMRTQARRRQLRQRFGAEYYRLVDDRQSKKKAEAELILRQRHVRDLGIRPLDARSRRRYIADWESAQEKFADLPAGAVADAQHLVNAVLESRGYPLMHREQVISDLSVEHAGVLDYYRAACDISDQVSAGTATTEDMRHAMIHYRAILNELLGTDG